MKIIAKGEPIRKTCPTCKCVFEYDVTDIKHISGMTCLNRGIDVIYCPQCSERINENNGFVVNGFGHLK